MLLTHNRLLHIRSSKKQGQDIATSRMKLRQNGIVSFLIRLAVFLARGRSV